MTHRRSRRLLVTLALAAAPAVLAAQFTAPHVVSSPGDVQTTLGSTIVINRGLVGMGRLSASRLDPFEESLGSISSMQVTGWKQNADGSYAGTLNILPDRGYNSGSFFADYAARINQVDFQFTPFTGASIGGTSLAEKVAAQNQIQFASDITGVRFTYTDPLSAQSSFTTGLDPGVGFTTMLFGGRPMPYVTTYFGLAAPGPQNCAVAAPPSECQTFTVNKLPIDAEALILEADGSGYIGDEYGAHIYYFDVNKNIVGAIVPPDALEPHLPVGTPNFNSLAAPTNGRRNNQGLEGVALSPDGTHLFALMQSGTVQDANSNQATRRHTWLLVYNVEHDATPTVPEAEYALTLPTFRFNPALSPVDPDRTAAQSEIVALDNHRVLVLSRDGNGLGHIDPNPSTYKSILLVDTAVGTPTDLATSVARNQEGGKLTTTPGVLDPAITAVSWREAINILNTFQLGRFNMEVDQSGLTATPYQVSKLTLGEKWEGMALLPALDPERPNDYFLLVGNDNDFLTSKGRMRGPGGLIDYNGFAGYAANRLPAPVDSTANENDTLILAYRVTIISDAEQPDDDATAPQITAAVTGTTGNNNWYTGSVNVSWDVSDNGSGIASLSKCGPTTQSADVSGVTLTCSATNGVGLTGSSSVTLNVDRTAPIVTPPANITVAQTELGGARVRYPQPTVVDGVSGVASVACLPASRTLFPAGTTTVTCTAADVAGNTGTATFEVSVTPAGDGRMSGAGYIAERGARYHFIFRVAQRRDNDYGRLEFWSNEPVRCSRFDDDRYGDRQFDGSLDSHYGQSHCADIDHFEATSIDEVVFIDDEDSRAGHGRHQDTDTAKFSGKGRWNGRAGYTFESAVSDRGEPGRGRDTFAIVVKDRQKRVVGSVEGVLDGGNIESTRARSHR